MQLCLGFEFVFGFHLFAAEVEEQFDKLSADDTTIEACHSECRAEGKLRSEFKLIDIKSNKLIDCATSEQLNGRSYSTRKLIK